MIEICFLYKRDSGATNCNTFLTFQFDTTYLDIDNQTCYDSTVKIKRGGDTVEVSRLVLNLRFRFSMAVNFFCDSERSFKLSVNALPIFLFYPCLWPFRVTQTAVLASALAMRNPRLVAQPTHLVWRLGFFFFSDKWYLPFFLHIFHFAFFPSYPEGCWYTCKDEDRFTTIKRAHLLTKIIPYVETYFTEVWLSAILIACSFSPFHPNPIIQPLYCHPAEGIWALFLFHNFPSFYSSPSKALQVRWPVTGNLTVSAGSCLLVVGGMSEVSLQSTHTITATSNNSHHCSNIPMSTCRLVWRTPTWFSIWQWGSGGLRFGSKKRVKLFVALFENCVWKLRFSTHKFTHFLLPLTLLFDRLVR